jgi:neutral ceramidase
LTTTPLQAGRAMVNLPLTPAAKERIGADTLETEIQVIACGPLALVALPGEPLTDIGTVIRERSPFPQTLVLGYSNGEGVHYVGLPGEKARGGYEMGVAGAGTDEAGGLIVDTALRVLQSLHERVTPKK